MESHSTVKEPPRPSSPRFYNLLGGMIAVLTLVLPLYITSHYSSLSALTHTPVTLPSSSPAPR